MPFFMLAGEIMNVGGLSQRIANFALALVGHIKGGLGYVTILAAIMLSALSGSAVADAAAPTALLLPMMVEAGHDKACAGGLIAASGVIGPVIPWMILVRKEKIVPPPRKSAAEILASLRSATWALMLPVIILVGLRFGVFTPTGRR